MSKETRRFFSTFSTRNFESFRRERLPVWRRTRTTQEKPISEFHEVTGPTGPARAKGDICVHKEVGVHNGNPLLPGTVSGYSTGPPDRPAVRGCTV